MPGPWSIRFLPGTYSIISVHNSVIGFSRSRIVQFSILKEKMLEIEAEPVTAVMEFSDKCNRILCASGNKLIWLHVSPFGIKTSQAAVIPIESEVNELVNLNTSGALTVMCYSHSGESIVIGINLKNLTVGEVVLNI